MRDSGHEDLVAGQFDVYRALKAQRGMENAINFLKGGLRIAQNGRGNSQLFEYLFLSVELADLVMEQRIFFALLHSRRATNHHNRRLFGERFGGGVGHFQAANAIRDADRAQPAHTRVGIGGEARALLVAGIDDADFAFGKQVVKREHIVAWYPEYVTNAVRVEALD